MKRIVLGGTLCVGLTDDPEATEAALGHPPGWQRFGPFHSEEAALRWKLAMAHMPGSSAGPVSAGWKFGYYYLAPGKGS